MTRSLRVLCIDDEADILFVMRTILTHAGHHAEVAYDVEAGLRRLRKHGPFDVAVINYLMPGRSGLELVNFLRGHRRYDRVGVVFNSAYPRWRLPTEHPAWARVDVFLPVPYPIEELLQAVHSAYVARATHLRSNGFSRLAFAGV